MRLIRTLPGPGVFVLGLILLFAAAQLGPGLVPGPGRACSMARAWTRRRDRTGRDKSSGPGEAARKGAAAGNGASGSGKAEGILVAEVLLLLVVGRVLGEGMQRIGQPALMGTLLAGIILGPSLFGWLWPAGAAFLFPKDRGPERHDRRPVADRHPDAAAADRHGDRPQAGAQIRLRRRSPSRCAASPFPLPAVFCWASSARAILFDGAGGRLVPSLFLGTALSISSIKIVAMVVREMNFMRRNLGQIIVATAIMEDTCGWVIIAITFGIAGRRRRRRAGLRPG